MEITYTNALYQGKYTVNIKESMLCKKKCMLGKIAYRNVCIKRNLLMNVHEDFFLKKMQIDVDMWNTGIKILKMRN